MTSDSGTAKLWGRSVLLAVSAGQVVAVAALVVGWWGLSRHSQPNDQIAWLDLGVGGLILVGAINIAMLVTGRRALGRRAQVLARRWPDELTVPAHVPAEHQPEERVVIVATGTRAHRPGCPLVAGKQVRTASPGVVSSRIRCEVCTP